MPKIKAVIIAADAMTAYGNDSTACWNGIVSGRSAIDTVRRFSTASFQSATAATIPGLEYFKDTSLVMQMLSRLIKKHVPVIPSDALLVCATTTGEIDLLEKQVLGNGTDIAQSSINAFLEKVKTLTRNKKDAMIVSSACASASAAIGYAAGRIRAGEYDAVVVVAADAVTEFVYSGFSSLMALDPDTARPFDKNRAGLSIGEGAGFVVLMSQARAKSEGRSILGEVAGWAVASDANHMTGPSRDGSGLHRAIRKALASAGISHKEIGCISAHGTGTVYNDSMEMKAYKSIFEDKPVPLYSIKGAIGHAMGAAGLIETIIALRVLEEKIIPSTVGLKDIDSEAKGWAAVGKRTLEKNTILLNNAGFGGVNASLVLKQ